MPAPQRPPRRRAQDVSAAPPFAPGSMAGRPRPAVLIETAPLLCGIQFLSIIIFRPAVVNRFLHFHAFPSHFSPRGDNKYPPAKPGVFHRRVKPWNTSARVTSRWYGLPAAKDCYLPPVNGLFRSFPSSSVRPPDLLPIGVECILLSFCRSSLLYLHSILCTRTPYCDT